MLIVKIILILSLGYILYQDIKERQVYWFMFPISALCFGILFYRNTLQELFYVSVLINFIFVSLLLGFVYLYTKIKLKTDFNTVFGYGDVLLFIGLSLSFSSVSFIIIFISSLIFSLVLHLVTKKQSMTVPLAGYMSLFFGLTYVAFWFGFINSLYSI
jgi:Type IV leader peptidase family